MGTNKFDSQDYKILALKARHLRKLGKSLKEIRSVIPVAKSTLSIWVRDINLTYKQRQALSKRYDTQYRGAKAGQMKNQRLREAAFKEGQNLAKKFQRRDIFLASGAFLFWAEGTKSKGLEFTNSDPQMVAFWIKWLVEFWKIEIHALSARLHLHEGQSEIKAIKYWSETTGIPEEQFQKTLFKPQRQGYHKNILYQGTIRINVKGKQVGLLRQKIMGLYVGTSQRFINSGIVFPGLVAQLVEHSPLKR